MKRHDITGQIFGKLLVLRKSDDVGKNTAWLCRCECGTEKPILTYNLLAGKSKSCGCVRGKKIGDLKKTHGGSGTRLYAIYKSMKQRCNNPKNPAYHYYGGKGVYICDAWEKDFNEFRNWSFSHGYKEGFSIDRIDPSGNYAPENCRWITMKKQQNNKLNSMFVVIGGAKHTIAEWAELTGTNKQTLYDKFYRLLDQLGVANREVIRFEIKLKDRT